MEENTARWVVRAYCATILVIFVSCVVLIALQTWYNGLSAWNFTTPVIFGGLFHTGQALLKWSFIFDLILVPAVIGCGFAFFLKSRKSVVFSFGITTLLFVILSVLVILQSFKVATLVLSVWSLFGIYLFGFNKDVKALFTQNTDKPVIGGKQ